MVVYRNQQYKSIVVNTPKGLFVYADVELLEALERDNELGNNLDNQIAFYVTAEELEEMESLKDNFLKLSEYCLKHDIYLG